MRQALEEMFQPTPRRLARPGIILAWIVLIALAVAVDIAFDRAAQNNPTAHEAPR